MGYGLGCWGWVCGVGGNDSAVGVRRVPGSGLEPLGEGDFLR